MRCLRLDWQRLFLWRLTVTRTVSQAQCRSANGQGGGFGGARHRCAMSAGARKAGKLGWAEWWLGLTCPRRSAPPRIWAVTTGVPLQQFHRGTVKIQHFLGGDCRATGDGCVRWLGRARRMVGPLSGSTLRLERGAANAGVSARCGTEDLFLRGRWSGLGMDLRPGNARTYGSRQPAAEPDRSRDGSGVDQCSRNILPPAIRCREGNETGGLDSAVERLAADCVRCGRAECAMAGERAALHSG